MSAESVADIKRHVRTYLVVFAALAMLTVVTVAISTAHLPGHTAIALALVVAIIKGSLIALFFMHLISERRVIYWMLGLCAVFFLALMFGPILTQHETDTWADARTGVISHVP